MVCMQKKSELEQKTRQNYYLLLGICNIPKYLITVYKLYFFFKRKSILIFTANQDWLMTFTTSNGSSKEVPCHYSDGYSWIVSFH